MTQGRELGRNRSVSQHCRSKSVHQTTWLSLHSTVQKKIPLYERHDGEEMRERVNYFVFESGGQTDLFGA